jgi:hypothetical protein
MIANGIVRMGGSYHVGERENNKHDHSPHRTRKPVRKIFVPAVVVCIALGVNCWAQPPAGFTWANLESDKATMAAVRQSVHDPSITAVREVGVEEGFALVMTASRENDSPTPDYDRWTIYNVALSTGKNRVLVSGYGVKILDWIGRGGAELAMTYYDCWECEAATLFTTLHFVKGAGWRARWQNKRGDAGNPQPGAVVEWTGDYDQEIDQVFAVVSRPNKDFAVGRWSQIHDAENGKLEIDVERYFVDPVTGQDREEKLTDAVAEKWKKEICTESNLLIRPGIGQDSKACKRTLRPPAARK